jgi:MATE family multidrug resistance protein
MTQSGTFQAQSNLTHARALLVLGLPLIGSHLAQMALHVTDTILLGWYGVEELAAVVLGSSMFFIIFILGAGFARAIMPLVATAIGRGDEVQVRRDTRMGLWLSIGYGVVSYPIFWWSGPLLLSLGQDPEVSRLAQDFMRIAGLGTIPALLVMVLKSYLAALGRTQVLLWITLAAVGVNLVFAYALIFGHWGMPELGVKGAAIASVVVQFFSLVAMAGYAVWLPELRRFHLLQRLWRPDWAAMGRVFRLGWPIGITSLAEGGLFQASALMMGWIGTIQLAAHGIAMEVASLTFMIHVGLSNAATIRTGRFAGEGDAAGLRRGARVAIALSVIVAVVMVAVMLLAAKPIITVFLDMTKPESAQIVGFGVVLLAYAALFQMADALQVMALGLLHGIRETRVPMWAAAVSYWLIGVPVAYLMAFEFGWGGQGLWLGLTVGLVFAALTMMGWFWSRAPRSLQS